MRSVQFVYETRFSSSLAFKINVRLEIQLKYKIKLKLIKMDYLNFFRAFIY